MPKSIVTTEYLLYSLGKLQNEKSYRFSSLRGPIEKDQA